MASPYSSDSHPRVSDNALHSATETNGHVSEALAVATPAAQADASRLLVEHLLASLKEDAVEEHASRRWNLSHYAGIVRRRWLPMLVAGVLVGGIVGWKLAPTEPLFTATSVMLLPAKNSPTPVVTDPTGLLGNLVKSVATSNPTTQIAIITSPDLVAKAILKLTPEERKAGFGDVEMKKAVAIAKVSGAVGDSTDIINITVMAKDEKVAVKLANLIIDAYADRTQELANSTNNKNLVLLKDQLKYTYGLMIKAKNELRDYKKQTGVVDLNTRLTAHATLLQELETKAASARDAVNAGVSDPSVASDETRLKLQQDVETATEKYKLVMQDFMPGAPEAKDAANDLQRARNALQVRTDALLNINRSRLTDIEKSLTQERQATANLPTVEVNLDQLTDKVTQLESSYKQVADRYTALILGSKNQVDTGTNLVAADESYPATRSLPTILGVALACALAMACIVAAILESTDHSLHSPEDVREAVRAPLLGSVPLLPSKQERRLPQLNSGDAKAGVLLEATRILRSNLIFAADGPLRSVLITSADMGEGKSLTAYNLAAAMALDGRRVLLLDCDLRRPAQHTLADCSLTPGLSNILQGEGNLDTALRPAGLNNLWVLPAGSLPDNPPELLGSEANRALLEQLRSRFDLLVLDSPPILSLADAQVLSSLSDGVLLVVAADTTPRNHVERAESMLRHVGARVLGVAFNKVKQHQDEYLWASYYTGNVKSGQNAPKALT